MKNKLFKFLLFILLFINCHVVYADANFVMVDLNYNTVYKGDVLDLRIGFDGNWFEGMVDYDSNNGEYYFYPGNMYKYKVRRFFIAYNPNFFELNFDDIKVADDNYYLFNFYEEKYDENKNIVFFELDAKKYVDATQETYDGKLDNYVLSGIKLKVKEDCEYGTYYIESNSAYEYYSYNDSVFYPISVIDKEKKDKSINKITFKYDSYYKLDNIEYVIDVELNKYQYDILLLPQNTACVNDYNIYTSCNSRCKIEGIGGGIYHMGNLCSTKIGESNYYKLSVTYDDGTKEDYTINDYYSASTINHSSWTVNDSKSAYYLIGDTSYQDKILEFETKLKDKYCELYVSECDSFKLYYYNFDELNEVDKKLLSLIKEDIDIKNEPYLFKAGNGKLYYEYQGFIETDEELEAVVLNKNYVPIDVIPNYNYDDITEKSFDKFVINNFKIILITFVSVIIVLIILITLVLIKRSKLKKSLNTNINDNLEQTKTLE